MAQLKTLADAVNYIRPEAKELVDVCMADNLTKHGYGKLLTALTKFEDNNMKKLLLIAMVEEGYPSETAQSVARIFGLS